MSMMKKIAGSSIAIVVSMAAFAVASEARADATAIADVNITSAYLSGITGADLDPTSISGGNSQQTVASLGSASISPAQTASSGIASATLTNTATESAGGSTSTASASLQGTLFGGVVTNTSSSQNLLNDSVGAAGVTKNGTQLSFKYSPAGVTAGTAVTVYLNISGSYTTYASTSNSNNTNQAAQADVNLSFSLKNTTAGHTQATQSASIIDQNSNGEASVQGANGTDGSLTPVAIDDTGANALAFVLIAGNSYTFTITDNASTSATAVPEPASLALLGAGLLGFGGLSLRRRKSV